MNKKEQVETSNLECRTCKATKEQIAEKKRKCWWTTCNKTAIIEDNGGWRWCLKHYWQQRDGYFSKMRKIIWNNILK